MRGQIKGEVRVRINWRGSGDVKTRKKWFETKCEIETFAMLFHAIGAYAIPMNERPFNTIP